jgi:hypothetical protein
MQSIHVIMIDSEIICHSILWAEHIVDVIPKIGCVDGRDALVDMSADIFQ